ncbi:MAG: hypothetical protein ACC645_21515 [Pirellulales bacterium]
MMFGKLGQSRATLFCLALCSIFTIQQAYGQFTTILNIPPDPDIGDNQSIGSATQLNLSDGGEIGELFDAGAADGTSTNVEVNIFGGSVGDDFDAFNGSTVNISGGLVGDRLRASGGSVVNISGGSVGVFFDASSGSEVNISGGSVGDFFDARGSEVNISGGSVGVFFDAFSGSVVNISGGSVGIFFDAFSGSEVNISGGLVGDFFRASGGSEVNLLGTQFVLDSIDITASLTLNVPFTINDRDVTLSGLLANGSPFSFDLNGTIVSGQEYFDPNATLSVTLTLPGDFDGDGAVSGTDFLKWQRGESPNPLSASDLADWEANYGTTIGFGLTGDFNNDGTVDGADFLQWQRGESPNPLSQSDLADWEMNYGMVAPLSAASTAVPEPHSLALFSLSGLLLLRSFRRATTFTA